MAADILDIPNELQEALQLLRENRLRLEDVMAKSAAKGFSSKHATDAGKLAAAVKALSAEGRLWADQLTARASQATPDQRTAAALKHILALPQGPRLQAYRQLCTAEAALVQPLGIGLPE